MPENHIEQRSLSAATHLQTQCPRILLVDDDTQLRETLALQLELGGFQVIQAESGAEALDLLNSGTSADMLVTDLSMPGLSGLEVIRAARQRAPGLPSVLLTGFALDDHAVRPGDAFDETFAVLRKPVPGAVLTSTISSLLGRE